MDLERLSRDFLRALRGHRSQTAFSRRLGYKSNVAYSWESGRRAPSAAEVLRAADRLGWDVRGAFRSFFREPPAFVEEGEAHSAEMIARFLDEIRGQTPMVRLAALTGLSRFSVARMLSGQTEPSLLDFFRLVEASSLRLLDWIASLVDPATLPEAKERWAQIEAQRGLIYSRPWTQAVLRVRELEAYRQLSGHTPGWIADRVGIPMEEEVECLKALSTAGQVRWVDNRWQLEPGLSVDTRRDPASGRRLKAWWTGVAREKLEAGAEGLFSYNVFSVSEADYARLRELHLSYFWSLRAIVAASEPMERVIVANVQLFPLDAPPETGAGSDR